MKHSARKWWESCSLPRINWSLRKTILCTRLRWFWYLLHVCTVNLFKQQNSTRLISKTSPWWQDHYHFQDRCCRHWDYYHSYSSYQDDYNKPHLITVIVVSGIITIIDILTQVLKQQNYKLEASNANLSMMSSTMSPLQVINRIIVMVMMMMTMIMVIMMMRILNKRVLKPIWAWWAAPWALCK